MNRRNLLLALVGLLVVVAVGYGVGAAVEPLRQPSDQVPDHSIEEVHK